MATGKPILNFVIDTELLRRIDDYWHSRKLPTRAESVRELLRLALDTYDKKK